MATFERSIPIILDHEGLYSNNPSDPGGETNYGISLRFLKDLPLEDADLNNDGVIDGQDIRNMKLTDARKLYRQYWWDRHGYSRFRSQALATKVFDTAVNTGASRAHRFLQLALNDLGEAVAVDGILGPVTFNKANLVHQAGLTPDLIKAFRAHQRAYYEKIIKANPKLEIFRKGWYRRADSC